jgi:SAM-dependent methyltransferase
VSGVESTAPEEGPDWSARAEAWAELWADLAAPARTLLLDAAGVGPGTRVLDLACGSGELVAQAAGRGARVAGVDAAEGMVAIARRRAPTAELRVGPIEALPWPDGAFDVVLAVNALQFAADFVATLREAARVTASGGRVGIANWAEPEHREILDVAVPMRGGETPPAAPYTTADGLAALARAAGLEPEDGGLVDVPFVVPDQATLERAFLADVPPEGLEDEAEERAAIAAAAAPFRRPDGSYRLENRFRWLLTRA